MVLFHPPARELLQLLIQLLGYPADCGCRELVPTQLLGISLTLRVEDALDVHLCPRPRPTLSRCAVSFEKPQSESTEQLCGHEFSATTISRVTEKLDEELKKFARRRVEEDHRTWCCKARYEKIRLDGVDRPARQCRRPSGSTGRAGVACWGWRWPIGERHQVERVSAGLEATRLVRRVRDQRRSPRVAQSDPGGAHHKQLLVVDQVRAERDEWVALGKAAGELTRPCLAASVKDSSWRCRGGGPDDDGRAGPLRFLETLSRSPSFVLVDENVGAETLGQFQTPPITGMIFPAKFGPERSSPSRSAPQPFSTPSRIRVRYLRCSAVMTFGGAGLPL